MVQIEISFKSFGFLQEHWREWSLKIHSSFFSVSILWSSFHVSCRLNPSNSVLIAFNAPFAQKSWNKNTMWLFTWGLTQERNHLDANIVKLISNKKVIWIDIWLIFIKLHSTWINALLYYILHKSFWCWMIIKNW